MQTKKLVSSNFFMQMQWLETSAFIPDMKKLNAYTEFQAINL